MPVLQTYECVNTPTQNKSEKRPNWIIYEKKPTLWTQVNTPFKVQHSTLTFLIQVFIKIMLRHSTIEQHSLPFVRQDHKHPEVFMRLSVVTFLSR